MKLEGLYLLEGSDNYVLLPFEWIGSEFGRKRRDIFNSIKSNYIYTYNIDGEPVGTITIKKYKNNILFMDLFVMDDYRTLGIGTKIMNHFIIKYRKYPIVLGSNIKNVRWFSKFCFNVINKIGNIVLMELKSQ